MTYELRPTFSSNLNVDKFNVFLYTNTFNTYSYPKSKDFCNYFLLNNNISLTFNLKSHFDINILLITGSLKKMSL